MPTVQEVGNSGRRGRRAAAWRRRLRTRASGRWQWHWPRFWWSRRPWRRGKLRPLRWLWSRRRWQVREFWPVLGRRTNGRRRPRRRKGRRRVWPWRRFGSPDRRRVPRCGRSR